MGLDIYRRRDIANILRSAAASSVSAVRMETFETNAEPSQITKVYHRGAMDMAIAIGLAFGLEPQRVENEPMRFVEVGTGRKRLGAG